MAVWRAGASALKSLYCPSLIKGVKIDGFLYLIFCSTELCKDGWEGLNLVFSYTHVKVGMGCKQQFDQLMSFNSHGHLFWDLECFMWKQLGWLKQWQLENRSGIYCGIGKWLVEEGKWSLSLPCSLQFDPAPRRGEPHVTRRTPDYFL